MERCCPYFRTFVVLSFKYNKERIFRKWGEEMFIASKNSGSKVFHNQYCSHVKQMSLENRRVFYTEDEAMSGTGGQQMRVWN